MTRRRKVVQTEVEEDEVEEFAKPKSKSKPAAKKQKTEPDWMQGNAIPVINLLLSVQKTECNNVKAIAELTKLYTKVNSNFD